MADLIKWWLHTVAYCPTSQLLRPVVPSFRFCLHNYAYLTFTAGNVIPVFCFRGGELDCLSPTAFDFVVGADLVYEVTNTPHSCPSTYHELVYSILSCPRSLLLPLNNIRRIWHKGLLTLLRTVLPWVVHFCMCTPKQCAGAKRYAVWLPLYTHMCNLCE